eukprot:TRINITY_DN36508_c0_g1_i1.p1 TRINITY_DN36508_c0_g1~~TRINITY_DN36508_c0_g1_i1.p1  ORF type:complete len:742 (+),score=142.07 TRINITY_DN36508_c0_g1_i1:26-2227(+)
MAPRRFPAPGAVPDDEEASYGSPPGSDDEEVLKQIDESIERKKRDARATLHAAYEKRQTINGTAKRQPLKTKTGAFDPDPLGRWRYMTWRVVSANWFDAVIGIIIMLNGFTIGVETQTRQHLPAGCDLQCNCPENPDAVCQGAPLWLGISEIVFFIIYVVESFLRVFAYGWFALRSHWVQFDILLVTSSAVEFVLQVVELDAELLKQLMLLRVLRMVRLVRAVRLMVHFQTLWKLVQGLIYSVPTLMWTFLVWGICVAILSLAGLETMQVDLDLPLDHPFNVVVIDHFRSVGDAMMAMAMCFAWDSAADIYRPVIKERPLTIFYFAATQSILAIAVYNVVIAVMVEGSMRFALSDNEALKVWEQERKKRAMQELKEMFRELDEDGSGELSLNELEEAPEDIRETLTGIANSDNLKGLFQLMDYDGGGTLAIDEFCEGVFKVGNSDKPIEVDCLMKQCGDIMWNGRKTIEILKDALSPEKKKPERQDGGERKKSHRGKHADVDSYVESLEARVEGLERMLAGIRKDVHDLIHAKVTQTSSTKEFKYARGTALPSKSSRYASHGLHGIKKTVAVCRGKVVSESKKSMTAARAQTEPGHDSSIHQEQEPWRQSISRSHTQETSRMPTDDIHVLQERLARAELELHAERQARGTDELLKQVADLENRRRIEAAENVALRRFIDEMKAAHRRTSSPERIANERDDVLYRAPSHAPPSAPPYSSPLPPFPNSAALDDLR